VLRFQCKQVLEKAQHVRILQRGLEALARTASADLLAVPAWDGPEMFQGPPTKVVAWLTAYNAINYCYWPDRGPRWWTRISDRDAGRDDEALGVMAAFADALHRGVPLDDAAWLQEMSPARLSELLAPAPGAGRLPALDVRAAALRELGDAWARAGGPMGLLEQAGGSAPGLARLMARACPSWEDARNLRGARLRFLKRGQLLAAMLYGRFGGAGPGAFGDVDQLTVFADYRLPQVLRGAGAVLLSPPLAERIARGAPILEGSEEEVEIRAATVHAAERLRALLEPSWPGITALQVDHLLWRQGVATQDTLPPFHRTRTTAY